VSKKNPMPAERWQETMARDRYQCQASAYGLGGACTGALIVHHKKLRGMGGTSDPSIHDLENLVVLCGGVTGRDGHHGMVHDHPREAYELGLLIRR
jgi:hypothetical protein